MSAASSVSSPLHRHPVVAFARPAARRPLARSRRLAAERLQLSQPVARRLRRECRPSARPGGTSPSTPLLAGDLRARADRDVIGDRRPARPSRRNPPIVTLPEMPICATITQCRPIATLWAIWTRLSILVPSPITVSRLAPRSIVRVGADLDIVLDDDAADLRHLDVACRPHGR